MGEFKKVLSYRIILLITINSIIGSGMFFLPAIGAKYAGPASLISWTVISIVAIYTAMVFGEMISMFPRAGGIYEFCKQAYGRFPSFIIGWIAWIVGNVTTAMLIVGAIQYILPENTPFFNILKLIVCLIWVGIFNYMAYRGLRTSSFMLVTFAVITVSIIIVLIASGLFHMDYSNLKPFFIHPGLTNIPFIFLSIFFISEAFFGLESVLFLAEETKNPEKTLPKALILATAIIAILTIGLVFVSLVVMPTTDFAQSAAPFADMAFKTMGSLGRSIVILGTYLVIIGAAAGWIVTGPRLIVSLTRDHLFPPKFGMFHPFHGSPYNAIKFQAAMTALFIIIGFSGEGYETLLAMLIPFVLIMMTVSIFAVLILRFKRKNTKRHYRAPLVFIGVPLVVIFNIALTISWILFEHDAWHILALCGSSILIGVPVFYFLQIQFNPEAVERTNDLLAYLALMSEKFNLPQKKIKKLVSYLGDLKDKNIYEYGCSVGTLTMPLAEDMDPRNNLYATDISRRSLRITRRRIDIADHKHVWLIHDSLHGVRIHPNVPEVNAIISVSSLSYIEKVDTVLSEMNMRLMVGNPVAFLVYDKMYHLISNINWLKSDAMIKHIFRRNGFLVNIERQNGVLWQYVFIFGKKVMDSHMIDIEEIKIDDVLTNQRQIKNIKKHLHDKLDDFKTDIIDKELGVFLQIDRTFDNSSLFVNYRYFEEILDFLLKIVFKYSINETGIHIDFKHKKDSLQIVFSFHTEEHIVDFLTKLKPREGKREEEDGDYVKALNSLIRLRKVIIEGYKGRIYIAESEKDIVAEIRSDTHTLIFGEFDSDGFNELNEKHLNIDIEIPLSSLEKHY